MFIACGYFLIKNPIWLYPRMEHFLRSKRAAFWSFGIASVWFLYYIATLGEADFGQYRLWLFLLFGGAAVGAFFKMEDFLSIRGVAACVLLGAKVLLDSAYMQPTSARLVLVTVVYGLIVVSIFVGAMPFLLREFTHWLFEQSERPLVLGSSLASIGTLLVVSSFFY
ncbi:MAG TPA: hypothetical protein DHV51_03885 [Opitutae bacterium]|nr:hypothetical protein [Opitutae bacterium]